MTLLGVDYTGGPETGGFTKILVENHVHLRLSLRGTKQSPSLRLLRGDARNDTFRR